MNVVSRRGFVASLGASVGAGCLPYVPVFANAAIEPDKVLHTAGDGIGIAPRECTLSLLSRLSQSKDVAEDNYLLGGEIEAFERHWAALLGKEAAVFMPSGTLAGRIYNWEFTMRNALYAATLSIALSHSIRIWHIRYEFPIPNSKFSITSLASLPVLPAA